MVLIGSPVKNEKRNAHVGWELAQGLVKVVHLRQNAHSGDDDKDICRGVGELVVASKSELEGNAESLDGHDGDGADKRADAEVDQRVLLAVDGGDLVDGDDRVHGDGEGVKQET